MLSFLPASGMLSVPLVSAEGKSCFGGVVVVVGNHGNHYPVSVVGI